MSGPATPPVTPYATGQLSFRLHAAWGHYTSTTRTSRNSFIVRIMSVKISASPTLRSVVACVTIAPPKLKILSNPSLVSKKAIRQLKSLFWQYDKQKEMMESLNKFIQEAAMVDLNVCLLKYASISNRLI